MFRTRVLAALAAATTVALPQAQSQAVSSIAYTFVLDCASPGAVTSLVDLPAGTYAVAIAGACSFSAGAPTSVPASTCGVTPAPAPCADLTVRNVPSATCTVGTGAAYARTCGGVPSAAAPLCGSVLVDGVCPSLGQAGTVRHTHPGRMTAAVSDVNHADNVGFLTATVVWTPL